MNNGTVFRLTSGGTLTTLASFHNNLNSSDEGSSPQAVLVQGTDGGYYGATTRGGTGGSGREFGRKAGLRHYNEESLPLVTSQSTAGVTDPGRVYRAIRDVSKPGPLDDDFSLMALTFV